MMPKSVAADTLTTPTEPTMQLTEVGLIPEDWAIEQIQDLCSIVTGSRNTQDKVEGGLYPFFVRSQTVERINSYSYDSEAVLTAGDGVGTGKVFHYIKGKFDFHQRVYMMSEFSKRLNGYYFYLYFKSRFYDRIAQMTAKSSVDSVRRDMIARMYIPLPSLQEQTAIATALGDADALIERLEQLIAKKRLIKQGAMRELLTPPGLNHGLNGLGDDTDEGGEAQQAIRAIRQSVPISGSDNWEVKTLGEVLHKVVGGGTPSRSNSSY